VGVTVELEGWDAILSRLQRWAGRGTVKAGVINRPDVVVYAPIQEFGGSIPVTDKMRGFLAANYGIHLRKSTGSINIPPRSFIRSTYEEHRDEWVENVADALNAGREVDDALDLVGERMEDAIIQKIASGVPPENSAATTVIKQQTAPGAVGRTLQQTGSLVHAISHEVE